MLFQATVRNTGHGGRGSGGDFGGRAVRQRAGGAADRGCRAAGRPWPLRRRCLPARPDLRDVPALADGTCPDHRHRHRTGGRHARRHCPDHRRRPASRRREAAADRAYLQASGRLTRRDPAAPRFGPGRRALRRRGRRRRGRRDARAGARRAGGDRGQLRRPPGDHQPGPGHRPGRIAGLARRHRQHRRRHAPRRRRSHRRCLRQRRPRGEHRHRQPAPRTHADGAARSPRRPGCGDRPADAAPVQPDALQRARHAMRCARHPQSSRCAWWWTMSAAASA